MRSSFFFWNALPRIAVDCCSVFWGIWSVKLIHFEQSSLTNEEALTQNHTYTPNVLLGILTWPTALQYSIRIMPPKNYPVLRNPSSLLLLNGVRVRFRNMHFLQISAQGVVVTWLSNTLSQCVICVVWRPAVNQLKMHVIFSGRAASRTSFFCVCIKHNTILWYSISPRWVPHIHYNSTQMNIKFFGFAEKRPHLLILADISS